MIIQCVGYFLCISYVIVIGHMLYNTFIIFFVYPLSWWSVIWYIMCRWFYECVFICSQCCLYDYTLLELISKYSKWIRQIPWLLMHSLVLSKAFDSLPQGLLIAKLSAYGVEFYSCRLLSNYLYNSHQKVKLGSIRSEWSDVTKGVPQGSILGPILWNVFITDILFLECDCHIYNYADDNCISYSSDTIDTIRNVLTNDINVFMNWFKQNYLKANPEKFQSMVISSHICDAEHISNVCIKAGWQTDVLQWLKRVPDHKSRMAIYDPFIMSHFNYCSIVWMFTSKKSLETIENIQKRTLQSHYHHLLNNSKSTGIEIMTLLLLTIEVYKCVNNFNPAYLNEMFTMKHCPYDLSDTSILERPRAYTTKYGLKSFRNYGAKICNLLPNNCKSAVSLLDF